MWGIGWGNYSFQTDLSVPPLFFAQDLRPICCRSLSTVHLHVSLSPPLLLSDAWWCSVGNISACHALFYISINFCNFRIWLWHAKLYTLSLLDQPDGDIDVYCFSTFFPSHQIEIYSSETLRLQLMDMFGSPLLFKNLKFLTLTPHFTPDILNIR